MIDWNLPGAVIGLESTKEFRNLRTKGRLAWRGYSASVLFAPVTGSQARGRIRCIAGRTGDFCTERAEHLGEAARDVLNDINPSLKDEINERSHTMSDLKDKAKEKMSDAAETAKKATDQAADKAKDLTNEASKKPKEGEKRLQDA
jgi:gas vesicle protein